MRLLVLLLAMLSLASPIEAGKTKASKTDDFQVRRAPFGHIISVPINQAVEIVFTVVIKNPTEKLWCPTVEVQWQDGTISRNGGGCAPFSETPPEDRQMQEFHFKRVFTTTGSYTITFRLLQQDKVVGKKDSRFVLRAPGGE